MSMLEDWDAERHGFIVGGDSDGQDNDREDDDGSVFDDWLKQRDNYNEEDDVDG